MEGEMCTFHTVKVHILKHMREDKTVLTYLQQTEEQGMEKGFKNQLLRIAMDYC